MNKKVLIGVILIAVAVFGVAAILKFGSEDDWICVDGQWIKHGHPSAAMPTSGCGAPVDNQSGDQTAKPSGDIVIESPQDGGNVSSPLNVWGKARGSWYFEASFPIKLVDEDGSVIAAVAAEAQSDWMTNDFVPFKATLRFVPPASGKMFLVLEKDNPSGLPENAASTSITVYSRIQDSSETMTVKAFFNNNKLDPEISCNKVFSVERTVAKTTAVARAALEELLKGPSESEKANGYSTSINSGVKIQKLTIENNVAKVDFDQTIQEQVGGSCRVSAIRSQITETLKQFSSVKDVVISVNGNTDEALQP